MIPNNHDNPFNSNNSSSGKDINVLALVKGTERYVFFYNDTNKPKVLRTLGRYASNPELSFTWNDAAVLSQKIREESQKSSEAGLENILPKDFFGNHIDMKDYPHFFPDKE